MRQEQKRKMDYSNLTFQEKMEEAKRQEKEIEKEMQTKALKEIQRLENIEYNKLMEEKKMEKNIYIEKIESGYSVVINPDGVTNCKNAEEVSEFVRGKLGLNNSTKKEINIKLTQKENDTLLYILRNAEINITSRDELRKPDRMALRLINKLEKTFKTL